MSKSQADMTFEYWYNKNSSKYDCESGMKWIAKLAWDHQQKRIEELEKVLKIIARSDKLIVHEMYDSKDVLNEVCDRAKNALKKEKNKNGQRRVNTKRD